MPGNGVEDRIHKLYGPDNSYLDQHQSQAVEDSWPGFNCNPWVGKWRQIGVAPSCDVKSFNNKKLDSVKRHGGESLSVSFNQNREYSNIYSRSQQLSSNEDMLGCHKFLARQRQSEVLGENTVYDPQAITSRCLSFLIPQQENVSGDSPTLTTNSERSEITEASIDFDLVGGKQQLVRGQQLHTPHTHLMQSGYNEMQLLQQHVVFKQLQELQRQQQLQHFGDSRQQNSANQISAMTKQAAGDQISPVINGTPVNDASHMLMNWMQQGPSPTVQGVSSRVVVSQDQGQALHSMGLASQQLDVSLYGTPIASARGSMSEYSHLHGMSHDSTNLLTKVSVQAQKPITQSSSFSNPLVGDQVTVSSEQVCFPQEGFISKQRLQGNNMFGQIPVQGLNSTVVSSNLQLGNTLQKNASPTEFNGRPERAGWSGTLQQKNMQLGPSQGLVPLDPMEEKILYNLDDNIWDTSFGGHIDMGTGGFGITLDPTDHSSAFPAIQSGSWSALMQSAVAETSSSDTGLQEEWSGLTFQNSELSTDNQPSNAMDSEKQQSSWLDSNLLSTASLSSRHFPAFNESSVSSSFPGFHQPGVQFSIEQRDTLHQDDSHESIRKSPKNSGEWIDCGHKQKPSIEGCRPVQPLVSLDGAWTGQIFEHPESDSHRQRNASINNVSQPCSELKGDINEATYQGRSFDDCLRESDNNSVASYFSRPARGLEPVHSGMDGTLPSRENSQIFNFAAVPNSSPSKAFRETGQHNQLDYVKSADISRNKENQSMAKNQHQMSNGSYVLHNYLEKGGGTDGMQQKCYQNDNSYENYGSKGFSGQEQEHVGQLKFINNVHSSALTLDKGHLPDYQGNSKASEIASRGDLDPSTTFRKSIHPHFEKVTAPTSENMLELLHKVDQSEENSSIPHFGSRACDSLVSETETPDGSVAHLYNQSADCQGFAMKLAPASQQLSSMNPFISSQDMPEVECNLSFRQAYSEIEKNQTRLAYPSVQSCSSSRESSQRSHWDNKFRISGQTSIPSSLYMPGVAAFTSSPPCIRNQLQMQDMPNAPLACSSSQATLAGTVSRYPPFDLAPSQPPVMSGMHQQGSFSERPHNVWTNVPVQQCPVVESLKVPAMDPSTNRWETSLVSPGINDQNSVKVGYGSSEFGTSPRNSQVFEHGAGQQEGGRSQIQKSSETHDASQTHSLDAFASGSLLAHSLQLDLDRIQHEDNNAPYPSERIIGTIGHSLKLSHVSHPNYSLLPQVQEMKNVDTAPSRRVSDVEHVAATDAPQLTYEENSKFRNQLDTGLASASRFNTSLSGDTKMQSFVTEARENFGIKASSQPALLDRPQAMVTTGQNDFLSQSTSSNVLSNHAGHPQINLRMAPSLFKQYEAFSHGQMPLLYDGRHAKTAAGQFSLWKPSQNLDIFSSGGRIDAADASESLSAPYSLPSDGTNQCMAIARPKKRKAATSGLLPWCKEVTQGSQRVQNISAAEHDWAKATNRLIEKVEDEAELVEDRLSMFQSKKRLIMTSQLMQQLFCPAPMSILSSRAVSQYDTLAYSVAKLSLGDACSLTSCTISRFLHVPLNNNTLISEKLKAFEGVDDQSFSEVVKDYSNRAKKLEIDLLRLDKVASILDVRVECQELEKFSVINRFAKFHIRQADSSGNSSSSSTVTPAPKPNPQRYVIAHPIPRNLPEEGLQCFSL
ncbi:hypothetical protein F2P56_021745 [Juglans regia]|uniref:Uncharacterized protein LOC108986444 n=2 Tax=Juglans regia TaxID=51240 RepID=A0A2I4E5C5_JUGRE|nr:uncharacterized protein LOC108986444 [Juglans regia]XP_018814602.1 uncharacterized protein LOC108986444 [Juglans regia]XP_018814605.1 uncharacterized protein LOC108986444 [Juglans regia]XP_035550419.1 uncharacterized protein LOC108986444 [Juglans regia]KAF5457659.1 hypothetical protein F2P56_021745 [Juglans regia]